MQQKDREDFLWRVLARYDLYINSSNTKAAFVLSLGSVLLGIVVTSGAGMLKTFAHPGLYWTMASVLGLLCIVLVASLAFAILVIAPFLKSACEPGDYHSKIFFGSVSEFSQKSFVEQIQSVSREALFEDLIKQVHTVACGANDKFTWLKIATRCLLWGALPLSVIFMVSKFIATIA